MLSLPFLPLNSLNVDLKLERFIRFLFGGKTGNIDNGKEGKIINVGMFTVKVITQALSVDKYPLSFECTTFFCVFKK